MKVSMTKSKKSLTMLWFLSAGILFLVFIFQTLLGRYGDKVNEAWGWLLPTIMPTLSLIIGVLVIDASGKGIKMKTADRFFYSLSFCLSALYLLSVALTIFIKPFVAGASPIDLMKQSNLWLGPFQGLVSASLGAFFVKVG
jgi:hypothetical protein